MEWATLKAEINSVCTALKLYLKFSSFSCFSGNVQQGLQNTTTVPPWRGDKETFPYIYLFVREYYFVFSDNRSYTHKRKKGRKKKKYAVIRLCYPPECSVLILRHLARDSSGRTEKLYLITPELLVVGRREKHSWFSCCVVLGQGPVTKRLCNSNSIPAAMTTWRLMAITSLGSSLWVSPWGQGDNQGSSFSIGFYWIHFTPRSTSCSFE